MYNLGIISYAVSSAPAIVGGYAYYVDAGNVTSYPGSGTTWTDLSGNSNVTTLTLPLFDADGGGSFDLDGSTEYAIFNYSSSFDLSGGKYAIEAWVKFNSFASAMIVVSKDTNGASFDWCIYVPSNTQIANYTQGTGDSFTATVPAMSTGVWYYISIVGAGTSCEIFLNSVSYGSGTLSPITNADTTAGTIGIASWNAPNTGTNGKISIVRIYDTDLSSADVTTNWNAQKTRFGY